MIEASPSPQDTRARWAWAVGWALAVAILVLGFGQAALRQEFGEPDNAMRLVEVRDFLRGQAWFDMVQHRLNPPDGASMHWARWIDLAIGAPIAALAPIVGAQGAEIAVAFIWPLGLLAVFMWLAAEIAGEIGARDGQRKETMLAGAIVAALAFPAVEKFSPGSFDHHNVELLLVLAAVLALMRMAGKPWLGAIAGAALGLAMATAAEGAPFVAAGLVVAGLLWLFRPEAYARALAWLGAGLILSSLVSFVVLVPSSRWAQPVCDAMATPFLGFGIAGGAVAGLLGLALSSEVSHSFLGRVSIAAVLCAIASAALIVLFPACSGGGYSALSDDMNALWMVQISESRNLLQLASDNPALLMGLAGAAFAGLVAAAIYLRKRWSHAEGWIVVGFLIAAWAVMAWQIRGSTFATAFAIPFGGWAVAKSRTAFRIRPDALRAAGFIAVAAGSAAAAWAGVGEFAQSRLTSRVTLSSYEARKANSKDCASAAALAPLARLPATTLLNHFSLGPAVLQRTPHSVVAAPYHRNGQGTMAMIHAMRASPDAARAIIAATSADHVLVCPALPEARFYAQHPADGVAPDATLAARLVAGDPPDWLEPVDLAATPLKLYRIVR